MLYYFDIVIRTTFCSQYKISCSIYNVEIKKKCEVLRQGNIQYSQTYDQYKFSVQRALALMMVHNVTETLVAKTFAINGPSIMYKV